jgi:molybdopterin-guanine dinucleotide biosynthesis protein B
MRVFGVIGSCRGKAGLLHRLIGHLQAQGMTVSTMKRVSDDVDLDRPGKDTYLQREAGAQEVVLANSFRTAILREHRTPQDEPDVDQLIQRLVPVDLVLIEGFRLSPYPKLEVIAADQDRRPHYLDDPSVIAIAGASGTSPSQAQGTVPIWLDIEDANALAVFVLSHAAIPGAVHVEAVA